MPTILKDNRIVDAPNARVVDGDLIMNADAFHKLSSDQQTFATAPVRQQSDINVSATWRQAGRPALSDASGDVWALGAGATERASALESLQAPDFTLPDLNGKPHSLSDYRGQKIFLATWASW